MFSSKQPHRKKDMAPEPTSFLNKMRKGLSGKNYTRRHSDDFSHAMPSRPLSFPQMDADTAIPYINISPLDKTRSIGNGNLASASSGLAGSVWVLQNDSMHMNGTLSNGTDLKIDENANKHVCRRPNSSKVSIFEKQGARPKVRKSSKGDIANLADNVSEGASPDDSGVNNPQGRPIMLSTIEPPCVEMEQLHLRFNEASFDCCSTSRTADSQEMNKETVARDSAPELLLHVENDRPNSSATVNNDSWSETEIPPAFRNENNQEVESEEIVHVSDTGRSMTPPLQVSETLVSVCRTYTQLDDEKAVEGMPPLCAADGELTTADLKCGASSGVLPAESHPLQNGDFVSALASPIDHQPQRISCSEYFDKCVEQDQLTGVEAAVRNGHADSENGVVVTGSESSTASVVTSVIEGEQPTPTCTSGDSSASKHCCTCTCGSPQNKTGLYIKNGHCNKKSTLTLESIPLAMVEELDSPQQARTPHIAMIINSNSMFSLEDAKEKPLDIGIQYKTFSYQDDDDDDDDKEVPVFYKSKGRQRGNLYTDPTKAFDAMKVSDESEATESAADDQAGLDNPQCLFGATGGIEADSHEAAAPRVDRSSKPRELKKSPLGDGDVDADEDPPPLPPRVPVSPSNLNENNRRAMSQFTYFDDDDDDMPTHESLSDLRMYIDPKNTLKSKSLPRGAVPVASTSPPEMRVMKRGKTVKNRFSQIFKPGSKKKRHSTHGFPDRPLPDIPPSNRLTKTNENVRHFSYSGTNSGETVANQTATCKEGSSKEIASKEDVDKAREQFAVSLRRISEYGWYWGPMSWDDAESRLEHMPDGSFLVRDSSDDRHLLSLSFRAQGSTHHTRVEHQNGKFSFWSQPCSHGSSSIVAFVEEAMRHSRSGRVLYFLRPRMPGYPPAAVQLLYPISRFQKARSLQHMCRFVIRKHVRLDHIDSLPLPRRLKDYLKEAQYYTQDDILH